MMNSSHHRLQMHVRRNLPTGTGDLSRTPSLALSPVLSLFLCVCTATLASNGYAADIYLSIDSDGSSRYATSALDSSYQLLQRGEPITAAPNILPAPLAARQQFLKTWLPHLRQLSQQHQVDLALILAIIEVESRYNPHALSPKGAAGLMQLMPSVATRYGAPNPLNIAQHLQAGVMYLRDLQKLHHDNLALLLAAYNAGQTSVVKHGQRIPPFKETMLYVPQVLAYKQLLHNVVLETPPVANVVEPTP